MKIWMLPVKYEYGSNSWAHILGRERHEEQIEIHDKNVNKITFNFFYVFRSVDACFFLLMVAKLGFPGVSKPILFLLHFPRNHQLPPAQEILWSCDLRMCWGIFKFEQVLFHSHFQFGKNCCRHWWCKRLVVVCFDSIHHARIASNIFWFPQARPRKTLPEKYFVNRHWHYIWLVISSGNGVKIFFSFLIKWYLLIEIWYLRNIRHYMCIWYL